MKIHHFALLSVSALTLAACSTFEGLQRDISGMTSSLGSKMSGKADGTQKTLAEGECPSISVDPQLNSASEFADMEKPSSTTKISTITLKDTKSECALDGEYLNMRIDLFFAGELGPKAKRKKDDRPFFAYPYFIAVENGAGEELARELFAASVTYDKLQEKIELVETIRQRLPLNENGTIPDYRVKIGFELTEDQLFYNTSR